MQTKTISILSALLWAWTALTFQVVVGSDANGLANGNSNANSNASASGSDEASTSTSTLIHEATMDYQHQSSIQDRYNRLMEETTGESDDSLSDGMLLPFGEQDPDCTSVDSDNASSANAGDCAAPPDSTIETVTVTVRVEEKDCQQESAENNNDSNNNNNINNDINNDTQTCRVKEEEVDKHWGSDKRVLAMRDRLRKAGAGIYGTSSSPSPSSSQGTHNHNHHQSQNQEQNQEHPFDANKRPPIFLMPGLAATRLVSWKHKVCHSPFLSDIKFQDYVWLNMKLLVQMGAIAVQCWSDCMTLGLNQTDANDSDGCKLRPDEGLDAIASLAPGSVGTELLVGQTNTVFAWLVQWLADNLGYDLSNIIGLPYDWRLSPHMMEKRDGFLSHTRRRIEAAVRANGVPGIMVAHSMGNSVFRYFLLWLRQEMRSEAYARIVKRAERRNRQRQQEAAVQERGWLAGVTSGLDELWNSYFGEEAAPQPESSDSPADKHWQFWELAKREGDESYVDWLEAHIWTYVGLSAPLLGAVNPLRSVISGENMGLPFSDEMARQLELSFGCTNTVNPISSKMAFCDNWEGGDFGDDRGAAPRSDLFCLDALVREIEESTDRQDPWADFPQLEKLLKGRVDWDTDTPLITIVDESKCKDGDDRSVCEEKTFLGPRDAQTGELFRAFSRTWKEANNEMEIKRQQMEDSFWSTDVPNMLNRTWDRPYIKHVIMAYGVDTPTEIGYEYRKRAKDPKKKTAVKSEFDGIPTLARVLWESPRGVLEEEVIDSVRGSLADALIKKKPKHETLQNGTLLHSGDGTIPYVSLSWAHTWLLHAIRAQRYTYGKMDGNLLGTVQVSHRPENELAWKPGRPPEQLSVNKNRKADPDTGTSHPHGTRYKPEMVKFHNVGKSRSTGMTYSTTVIEAAGVEHKETTRNYDILAAAFSEVLSHMHSDFGLV